MPKFTVMFSTMGSYETEVEAETQKEAIELAYQEANEHGDPEWQFEEVY